MPFEWAQRPDPAASIAAAGLLIEALAVEPAHLRREREEAACVFMTKQSV
jgi:hypothetical protein